MGAKTNKHELLVEELAEALDFWMSAPEPEQNAKLVELWNIYCDANQYNSDHLYANEPEVLNSLFQGKSPYEVICAVCASNYGTEFPYFSVDDGGALSSNDLWGKLDDDMLDDLAAWLLDRKGADWLEAKYGISLECATDDDDEENEED